MKFLCVGIRISTWLTSWSRVLLEKLSVFQLVKKFLTYYGTRSFITAFTSARRLLSISARPRLLWTFRNRIRFYGELLAARPTPKLEDHPLSAVRDCLFNIFATNLQTGDRSSIRNLRTRHAVVTGTHLSRISTGLPYISYVVDSLCTQFRLACNSNFATSCRM